MTEQTVTVLVAFVLPPAAIFILTVSIWISEAAHKRSMTGAYSKKDR